MGVVFFPSLPFMGVSCYSLALRYGMRPKRAVHFLCRFLYFLFFFLFLSFSSPSPSLSFSLPPFLLFFHISFFLFPFLMHKLFPSLFSSSSLFHLFPFLLLCPSRFPFLFLSRGFFFFFFFEGTACTVCFQDVIDDTTDCN